MNLDHDAGVGSNQDTDAVREKVRPRTGRPTGRSTQLISALKMFV